MIEALSAIKRPVPMVLHLDSQYVKNGILEWMPNWKSRGWKTAAGKPVKNVELRQTQDQLVSTHDNERRRVKGHAREPGNEKADELANRGVPKTK